METIILRAVILQYALSFGAPGPVFIPKKNDTSEVKNYSRQPTLSKKAQKLFEKSKDLPLVTLDHPEISSVHVTFGQQSSPLHVLTQYLRGPTYVISGAKRNDKKAIMGRENLYVSEIPLHIRHKRATNDTSSSGFLDDPNNVAMYIVLPVIVLIYGGCMVIYCCYKCQDYMERTQPIATFKRKIFRLPDPIREANSPALGPSRSFLLNSDRERPGSSQSMPPEDGTRKNFDDLRSIASTPGLRYSRNEFISVQGRRKNVTDSDLSLQVISQEDMDSGVQSDETPASRSADDRTVYIDGHNREIRNILTSDALKVEVKHVTTVEIGVQTDDTVNTVTFETKRAIQSRSKSPQKKSRRGGKVASRYLDWLKNSKEIQDVIHNRLNPTPPKLSERHPIKPARAGGVAKGGSLNRSNSFTESNSLSRIKSAYNSVVQVEKDRNNSDTHAKSKPITVESESERDNASRTYSFKGRFPPSSYVSIYKQQKSNSTQKLLTDAKNNHRSVTSSSASDNSVTNDSQYSVTNQKVFYISGSPDVNIT